MKNVIRVLGTLVLILCMASAEAQDSKPPMRISVDFARFRGDDTTAFVEIYYGFPQNVLTYVNSGDEFKAGIELSVTVRSKDSLFFADRFIVPHVTKNVNESAMNLVSKSAMMVREGDYTLQVVGKDVNDPSRVDSLKLELPIKVAPTDQLVLSDIEFASSIRKGQESSPFYKNTLDVVPNVDGVFGADQRCYYYAEAYNLLVGGDKSDLVLKTAIYNAIGKEIISRERPRRRSGESTVLVDNIDVANLKSGTYTLMLSLEDSTRKTLTTSWKKFFVYNAKLGIDSSLLKLDPAIVMNIYAKMEEPELDREFKQTRWESMDAEKEQFDKLEGADAKRKFLSEFWAKRPAGARDEYFRRLRYANGAFNTLGFEGYRTDRGRVHITYGPADDIDRHPNEAGTKPYEVWTYHGLQGGVIFVFVQRQNSGDYELVHSTHRNELHDENWSRYAQSN